VLFAFCFLSATSHLFSQQYTDSHGQVDNTSAQCLLPNAVNHIISPRSSPSSSMLEHQLSIHLHVARCQAVHQRAEHRQFCKPVSELLDNVSEWRGPCNHCDKLWDLCHHCDSLRWVSTAPCKENLKSHTIEVPSYLVKTSRPMFSHFSSWLCIAVVATQHNTTICVNCQLGAWSKEV
jgi:hypothetical protein